MPLSSPRANLARRMQRCSHRLGRLCIVVCIAALNGPPPASVAGERDATDVGAKQPASAVEPASLLGRAAGQAKDKQQVAGNKKGAESPAASNVHRRGSFVNSRIRFERDKKGHVAFIGGSITEMNGYRPMVSTFLKLQFPATELTFTDAGIASTCSTTGAFRLQQDVLDKGPVDLFFIEFAVNDDQDAGHARRECIRGMEGIVKHTLAHNPHADIVITHFVNPGMLETIRKGETPLSIAAHETVAERYAVTTIDLAQEVSDRITAGRLTWEEYGGTHPKPFGNAMCASMIEDLLAGVWKEPLRDDEKFTRLPKFIQPLDERSYNRGRFVDPKEAKIVRGWNLQVPDWDKLPGSKRDRFTGIPMLCATSAEAEASLEFTGTAIGASIVAGPDAGIVDASIDGGEFQPFDLYHRFSKGLHYPRTVMFNADLKPGRHTLRLRVSQKRNAESTGHAMRIIKFAVNGDG